MILCNSCSPRKGCTEDKNRTGCRFYQPMTEQEYIQTCNTEQLAELLLRFYYQDYCMNTKRRVIEWLKQPRREE